MGRKKTVFTVISQDHQEKMTNRSHRIRPELPKTQSPQCQLPRLQVERQVVKQPAALEPPTGLILTQSWQHLATRPPSQPRHHPGAPASPLPAPTDSSRHPPASSPASRGHGTISRQHRLVQLYDSAQLLTLLLPQFPHLNNARHRGLQQ